MKKISTGLISAISAISITSLASSTVLAGAPTLAPHGWQPLADASAPLVPQADYPAIAPLTLKPGQNGCLPINQPIPFTISKGYYDGSNLVGGQLALGKLNLDDPNNGPLIQGHIDDLSGTNIGENDDVGTVVLKPTPLTNNDPNANNDVSFNDSSVRSQLQVMVEPDNDNDDSAVLHGMLTIKTPELLEIAGDLAHRVGTVDPTTHLPVPQVSDFCVTSVAIAGNTSRAQMGNSIGTAVILYMNKGNFEFEAENTDQQTKLHSDMNAGGDIQTADLSTSTTSGGDAIF
jgi:hypothetical protein